MAAPQGRRTVRDLSNTNGTAPQPPAADPTEAPAPDAPATETTKAPAKRAAKAQKATAQKAATKAPAKQSRATKAEMERRREGERLLKLHENGDLLTPTQVQAKLAENGSRRVVAVQSDGIRADEGIVVVDVEADASAESLFAMLQSIKGLDTDVAKAARARLMNRLNDSLV